MIRPILFNTEMVKAILEGRKTVTRRIIKPQPEYCTMSKAGLVVSEEPIEISDGIIKAANAEVRKPPFEAGDILYVRETWCKYGKLDENDRLIEGTEQYYYRADGENPTPFNDFLVQHPGWDEHRETPVWHPSIHMPKEAARLFLRVTDVRAEHLQDISKDPPGPQNQVVREGCRYGCDFIATWQNTMSRKDWPVYGWFANPWVWVIEFNRCDKPEGFT